MIEAGCECFQYAVIEMTHRVRGGGYRRSGSGMEFLSRGKQQIFNPGHLLSQLDHVLGERVKVALLRVDLGLEHVDTAALRLEAPLLM